MTAAEQSIRERLLELADRLETATGPDRGLDGLIFVELNPDKRIIVGAKPGRFPREAIYGTPRDLIPMLEENGKDGADYLSAPFYTASIDAALLLVPKGWNWSVGFDHCPGESANDLGPDGCASVWPQEQPFPVGLDIEAEAATPALALCATALRVRATSPTKEKDAQ